MEKVKNIRFSEELIMMPLYTRIEYDDNMIKTADVFPIQIKKLEFYCPKCKIRRIFTFNAVISPTYYNYTIPTFIRGDMGKVFRYEGHDENNDLFYMDIIVTSDNTIMKIGQFPSVYDCDENVNNKHFLNSLSQEYKEYYKNAHFCYINGFHIGAFTYLRRVFEQLIIDTFEENKSKIDETKFTEGKTKEKVILLKDFLPEIMFEQGFVELYTKISDGVHNLSEDDCAKNFLILKSAIEEVLIERQVKLDMQKRRDELKKQIMKI